MADSYFVSKPTPHLAKIADDTRKSALGIQDEVYAQRLRDAAKKSQQFQQHGFKMGQIGHKGGVDAYTTGLGMGINLPQTLAGQRNALATKAIQNQLGQARTAINLGKSAPYFAALDKQGLRVVPGSVQNIPLSKILETIRLGGAPTQPEADITTARIFTPKVKPVGTESKEMTGVVYDPTLNAHVQRKTKSTSQQYGSIDPRTSTMTPVTTGSAAIIERAKAAGHDVPKTVTDMAISALRKGNLGNPNDQQIQRMVQNLHQRIRQGIQQIEVKINGQKHRINVTGIDANGNLIYE